MKYATCYTDANGVFRSIRTGHVVCKCGRGYGSDFDGKCTRCRGGVTAWDQKRNIQKRIFK